jgi:cyclohexanone monooxygenase
MFGDPIAMSAQPVPSLTAPSTVDALVVGAGFAGLYLVHRLRGQGLKVRAIEAGSDVGGTWYWNRYPGARCDVESMEYSYSFSPELEQEWAWTERYAAQPEIQRYLRHVSERFDLRREITFDTKVTQAAYDAGANRWRVQTDRGEQIEATWLVMATGCLSVPKLPEIEGCERFAGASYHSGHWPHEPVDFTGKTVGIIGTGSTSIQLIPKVAEQAARVLVFQRTPNFSLPSRNAPMDAQEQQRIKQSYRELRKQQRRSPTGVSSYPIPTRSALEVGPEEREQMLEAGWARGGTGLGRTFNDVVRDPAANEVVADFVRRKIRSKVTNPEVAEALTPRDHYIATKRICVDSDYYETYNRPNVTLVDLRRDPLVSIEAQGVRTRDHLHAVDVLVYATGFDAMTGAMLAVDIRNGTGRSLRDTWADGPKTYLGLAVAGFPNLFMVTGPGSPSVLSNMVVSIEQHVEWISECIGWMRTHGKQRIEARTDAQEHWVTHVNEVADATLFAKANSWYTGANVPGKPRVFMPYLGGVAAYGEKCAAVAQGGYTGFMLDAAAG